MKKFQNKKNIKKNKNVKSVEEEKKFQDARNLRIAASVWKNKKKPKTLSGWQKLKWPGSSKQKKQILLKNKPSFLYSSYWFGKFINKLMQRGRKAKTEKIVFLVFKKFKMKYHKNALKIFFSALVKNRPLLWFAPVRIGRQIKKVPIPLSPRKQLIMSLHWFAYAVRLIRFQSGNIATEIVLYKQLEDILNKEESLLTKRRIDHVKELVENRVNLNFRYKIKK